MSIDCRTYDNEQCKKATAIEEGDVREIIALACWGVYCQGGEYIQPKIKDGKMKGEPKLVTRGQRFVFDAIREYTNRNAVSDLFFVGDNIYQNAFSMEEISTYAEQNGIVGNEKVKIDRYIKDHPERLGYQIDEQFRAFTRCYEGINIKRTFIGIGNHEIESCDILNRQLTHGAWGNVGVYYRIHYQNSVTVIMMDTNMYDHDAKHCDQNDYSDEDRVAQYTFVLEECKKASNRGDWVILMGHIPYRANGHKETRPIIHNMRLHEFFYSLREAGYLPHIYICGDEHNQQFIYNKELGLSLSIIGSGGTELDTLEMKDVDVTCYAEERFGFIVLKQDDEHLIVKYMVCSDDSHEESYSATINKDGRVVRTTPVDCSSLL